MHIDSSAPAPRRRSRRVAALGALAALTAGAGAGALALAAPALAAASDGTFANPTAISMADHTTSTAIDVPENGVTSLSGLSLTLTNITDGDLTNVVVTLNSPNAGPVDVICGQSGSVTGQTYTYTSGSGVATCGSSDLSAVLGADPAGSWTVSVSNPNNPSDTDTIAGGFSLAMTAAPVDTADPTDVGATSGDNAQFIAHAAGYPAPSVQWQKSTDGTNFTNIDGATADILDLNQVTTADNDTFYQAVFSNAVGTITSTPAMLTVGANTPTVTTQPNSTSVVAGTDAIFTAAATSDPASTVQWQVSTDGGKTFGDIMDATSSSYTVSAPALDSSGNQYRAVFTNDGGSATSDAATLTVTGRVPSAPGHFAAHQTGPGQVTVSWTASTDAGSPATIKYYQPGWGTGQMGDGDAVSADKTSDVFNNLQPGSYTFSVAAINDAGSSPRVSLPLTVVAPVSTPTLSVSAHRVIEGTHVVLSGQGPASQHVTLQRELPGATWVSIATVTTTNYGHYAFTVPANHTAYYRTRTTTGKISTAVKVVAVDKLTLRAVRTSAHHYTLSGAVLPVLKGQIVKVYASRNGGAYVLVAKLATNKYGRWAVAHVFKSGTYTFKAVSASVPLNAGGTVSLTKAVS